MPSSRCRPPSDTCDASSDIEKATHRIRHEMTGQPIEIATVPPLTNAWP